MGKVAIYSQGRCGTHYMLDCLGMPNLAKQYNIHAKQPPKNFNGRILYMYADPRNELLSAININDQLNRHNKWLLKHCKNLEGDVSYFFPPKRVTIEQILNDMYDPFKLEEHFLSWLNVKTNNKIMLLKYEALECSEIFQGVLNFLGITQDYKFDWIPRRTDFLALSMKQQIQINKLFEYLLCLQKVLPPYYIVKG